MATTRVVRAFGAADVKSVRRDSMLRWMPVLPVLMGLAVRFVLPTVLERMGQLFNADLMPYFESLAGAVLLLITPIIYGMVVGFLFLDQRDNGTLTALRVTPVSLQGYMAYRLSAPMVLSVVMTLAAFGLAGVSGVSFPALVVCTLVATPLAAIVALALPAFAQNKVQGFALQKAGSVLMLPVLVAYFLSAEWQPLFWILPTYWAAKLYWSLEAADPMWWAYLIAGLAIQAGLIWLLLRRVQRVMDRG